MPETELTHAEQNAKGWFALIEEMVNAHSEAVETDEMTEEEAMEKAHNTILESVLEVTVRSGWYTPNEQRFAGSPEPQEYCILLSTGGPALRIVGKLDRWMGPETAQLEYQDWGIKWQESDISKRSAKNEAKLVEFANFFYFGEG
jgi:hypothetical protein